MALRGELVGLDGAICKCGAELVLDVQRSPAGFFLGYFCGACGPFSRETGYWILREDAWGALDAYIGDCIEPSNLRTTQFNGGLR